MPRNQPLLQKFEFIRGGLERNGQYVSTTYESGVYIIRRHPDHPAGQRVVSCKTLRMARTLSSELRNEKPKPPERPAIPPCNNLEI